MRRLPIQTYVSRLVAETDIHNKEALSESVDQMGHAAYEKSDVNKNEPTLERFSAQFGRRLLCAIVTAGAMPDFFAKLDNQEPKATVEATIDADLDSISRSLLSWNPDEKWKHLFELIGDRAREIYEWDEMEDLYECGLYLYKHGVTTALDISFGIAKFLNMECVRLGITDPEIKMQLFKNLLRKAMPMSLRSMTDAVNGSVSVDMYNVWIEQESGEYVAKLYLHEAVDPNLSLQAVWTGCPANTLIHGKNGILEFFKVMTTRVESAFNTP